MSKVLYVRVADEVHDRVALASKLSGMSMTAVVDRLLRRALRLPEADDLTDIIQRVSSS